MTKSKFASMVQYGARSRFAKAPRSWSEMQAQLVQDKVHLHGVKRVTLHWSNYGAGQTGLRHFKYHKLPPLRYWNPDIAFETRKVELRRASAAADNDADDADDDASLAADAPSAGASSSAADGAANPAGEPVEPRLEVERADGECDVLPAAGRTADELLAELTQRYAQNDAPLRALFAGKQ